MYNEYFQWKPVHNENSEQVDTAVSGCAVCAELNYNAWPGLWQLIVGGQCTSTGLRVD